MCLKIQKYPFIFSKFQTFPVVTHILTLFSLTILSPLLICGCFPNTIKQFSDTNRMSYDLTQFWHYLPEDSIWSLRLRARPIRAALASPLMPITSPGCHVCFWPMSWRCQWQHIIQKQPGRRDIQGKIWGKGLELKMY